MLSLSKTVFRMYVNPDFPELLELYKIQVENHNKQLKANPFHNAGFDLLFPEDNSFDAGVDSKFVDFKIKGEMVTKFLDDYKDNPETDISPDMGIGVEFHLTKYSNKCIYDSYYIYPRSSISKSPLMMANNVGIIDSSYRGNLIGAFRNLSDKQYNTKKYDRLVQICHPSLKPFYVEILDDETKLTTTTRGSGGFGSTGK